jgi:hypothetical protein
MNHTVERRASRPSQPGGDARLSAGEVRRGKPRLYS